jgi:hypothetical protein
MIMVIALDMHRKPILSRYYEGSVEFEGKTVRIEPVECWRCGSIEKLDVQGVDASDIRRYECEDCVVCDSCRHFEGYRCPDWPSCNYKV